MSSHMLAREQSDDDRTGSSWHSMDSIKSAFTVSTKDVVGNLFFLQQKHHRSHHQDDDDDPGEDPTLEEVSEMLRKLM